MKSLSGKTTLPFDVHLMIEDPDRYLEDFVTEQTEYITVHQEACVHLNRTIPVSYTHLDVYKRQAMTYVAALATSVANLIRILMIRGRN